jgi:cytochrome c553
MKEIMPIVVSFLAIVSLRAQDGKTLWIANCTPCHGASGKGDTKMGEMIGAMDLTDSKKQALFTDAQAAEAIRNGVTNNGVMKMTAFNNFSDADVKALVA